MNSPIMQLIFQFRQVPITAQGKSMARNMAFADKEAVIGTMLNTSIAGLVRYAKFATIAGGISLVKGTDFDEEFTDEYTDTGKYVSNYGLYGDVYYDLILGGNTNVTSQIPVLGLMNDYSELGSEDAKKQLDATFGLLPLGNTYYADLVHAWLQQEVINK